MSLLPWSSPGVARRRSLPLAGAAVMAVTLLLAPSASAADSCRGSAARATAPDQVASEPVVANPEGTPCASDEREAAAAEPVGPVTAAFPRAQTRRAPGLLAAQASVEGASIPAGSVPITVGAVTSEQVASCADGATVVTGSSSVDALVVNGTPVPIVADRPVDLELGPVRVRANQLIGDTRTALILDYADGRQVVLGETTAAGDACTVASGGSGGGSTGGAPRICPDGSTYDVERNVCVIRESEGGGSDGAQETIVVGRPYEGPRGGSLISLDEARQRVADGTLRDSPCLRGAGPEFVVLGTAGRDTITGANSADRILALGGSDRVSGGVGDDCVDGAAGTDRLTGDNGDDALHGGRGRDLLSGSAGADRLRGGSGRDVLQGGNGNDRLWGGRGRDAVNGGSGTDRLSGGRNNDTINTGFGRDSVDAGSGRDAINASTAGPASRRIRCGRGRDTLRINRNERRRHRGCERVFTIR